MFRGSLCLFTLLLFILFLLFKSGSAIDNRTERLNVKDYYIGQKDAADKDAVMLLYAVHECSGPSSQTKLQNLRSYPKHPPYYFYMLGILSVCCFFIILIPGYYSNYYFVLF